MAYFARKIKYCANTYSFVALIEIAAKKGGKPVKFILYRCSIFDDVKPEMIEFKSNKKERAEKFFPFGWSISWIKTTKWLYEVGVGGGYQIHPKGSWVKVGRPTFWKKRRKKFRPKFGELAHILVLAKGKLRIFFEEKSPLEKRLDGIRDCYDEDGEWYERDNLTFEEKRKVVELITKIEEIEVLINSQQSKISEIKKEMRFKRGIKRGQ